MKTYAPKYLAGSQLREMMADLQSDPAGLAKYLQVSERTVWRWLADGSAPYAVLAALWHETPRGREVSSLDVGNALVLARGLAASYHGEMVRLQAQLGRVLAINSTGAANDAAAL